MTDRAQQGDFFVYAGTFTRNGQPRGKAEGIYILRLRTSSGALAPVDLVPGVVNPAFLAFAPGYSYLYAVNEIDEFNGAAGGAVSAFAVDRAGGGLTFLNQQPTHGAGSCYVSVDQTGKWVAVANYRGGNATLLPVVEGGKLGAPTVVQHSGSSVNLSRQERAHAHSAIFDPSNRFVLVADLGMDRVMVYRLDATRGVLVPHDPPSIAARPGAGPRHQAFHPNNRIYYVLNELDSTISVYAYDAAHTTLRDIQWLSTLPVGFAGTSTCAEIQIAPSGRFIYASNRGHDSIAAFAIDQQTGMLSAIGHTPTQGECPRNFVISPGGDVLLAANQKSDTVVTFWVDQASGKLSPTGHTAAVPTAVCLRLMPAP